MTVRGSPDPYSFVTYNTGSYFETDSGATTGTLGEVTDFSDGANSSYADEYTISGPPASTVTDEMTSTGTTSGDPRDTSNGTLIPAYWDTEAVGLATSMGTSPLDAPIQDGTTTGEWDTSKNLVSALGGQDMHALQFTGAEVQPALSGSAIVLEQGAGGSGTWVSHPSAIGYRRQGYVTSGSHGGSGSTTITIAAVAPEFDSGMNIGADQDETERLLNFSQGAEENPTVAQTQPTSRAQQQVSGISSGADMMNPSYDNPTWRAGANPFGGNGYYSPFAGWFGGAGGGAGAGGEGGIVNAPAQTPNIVSMRMYPVSLGPGSPPPVGPAEIEDDDEDDEDDDDLPRILTKAEEMPDKDNWYRPGQPVPGSQTNKAQPVPGSQIDPGQPATPADAGGPSMAGTSPAGSGDDGPQIAGGLSPIEPVSRSGTAGLAAGFEQNTADAEAERELWNQLSLYLNDKSVMQNLQKDAEVKKVVAFLAKKGVTIRIAADDSNYVAFFQKGRNDITFNSNKSGRPTEEKLRAALHESVHAIKYHQGTGSVPLPDNVFDLASDKTVSGNPKWDINYRSQLGGPDVSDPEFDKDPAARKHFDQTYPTIMTLPNVFYYDDVNKSTYKWIGAIWNRVKGTPGQPKK